jgi:hypothetical protein
MTITEPLRVVEDEWPELARKLPPEAPSAISAARAIS